MQQIKQDIEQNNFKSCYLLYGPEEYLKGSYTKALVKALAPDGNSMNFTTFDGEDTDPAQIVLLGNTLPFFADKRTILVKNSGLFKAKAEAVEELADFIRKQPDTAVLVFSEAEIDKRNVLYKAIQKCGRVASFDTQDGDFLVRWVYTKLKKEGRQITRPTLEKFLSMTGTDMENISQELEKLICYTMGRSTITDQDVEAICTQQLSDRIFDMISAVAGHQQKKAMELYTDLLELKTEPRRILFLLARQFNMLFQIRGLLDEGLGQNAIAAALKQPPWLIRKSIPLCKGYRTEQLRAITEEFVQTEEDVKSGRLNDRISVEMLIVRYSTAA
ncbi:MAG: DNA polymerase III subunit delta [Eubacterium sp.]|nr:DNA polymerase III subunit delta [Eubacterium sp.]